MSRLEVLSGTREWFGILELDGGILLKGTRRSYRRKLRQKGVRIACRWNVGSNGRGIRRSAKEILSSSGEGGGIIEGAWLW